MESETIKFNEAEGKDGFLIKDDSAMIHIFPSRSNQKVSSSKVKLTNVVNYAWDAQHGIGRLISPHYSGKFIAYCIKVANVGAVRVVDLNTQERVLMKGSRGLIKDVEFMHKSDDMVLGFIDEYGSFYIYKIMKDLKTQKMQTALIFQVSLEGSPSRLDCRRFIWCKFVPDESNDIATPRDFAYHFAVCEDDLVYVANLVQLVQKFGEGTHTLPSLKGHYMTIDAHASSVVDASFSPDGTALATASKDGTVKFFQVYLVGDETPRCLYSWSPHEGNPVTKMFFLDDHTLNNPSESQYWKYMITAGANMSELKLWTCKSWECLQTIKFCCPSPSTLKMDLNINAKFLVLSDVHRKVMFVLNLEHDDDTARFCWINEFSLPVNMIGFNIREAFFATNQQIADRGFEHFVSSSDTDDAYACIVDVIFVQPKSLMEAAVAFRPPTGSSPTNGQRTHSRISFDDSVSYKDDDEEDAKLELEVEDEDEEENILEPEEAIPKVTRSPRATSHSPSRIPTPVSTTRIGSKSPATRRSPSPRPPSQGVCVSQMTQQLNSLMGVGVGVGFGNNLTGSLSTGHVEGATGHSPFHGMNLISESATGPIRIRTSSDNGNLSNASSSPSREVEEILSPKNNESMIHNKLDTSYNNVESTYTVNNLDVEGNILHARDIPLLSSPKSFQKLPVKVKSLGGGELGSPQLPQVLEQVNSIMDMMKTQAQEMQELKREVSRLNNAQNAAARQLDENGMTRVMDKYFGHNQTCLQRLEDTIKTTVFTMERQSAGQIPPNLVENVSATVGHAVKTEIETRVLPQLVKVFEPAKHQINNDIEKLVKAAEARVKHQIGHIFNGHDFRNALVPELSASLKSVCDGVITQVFTTSVVPNFEKALQNIFAKVNDTFMAGTKEYLGALEASLTSGRQQNENSQEAIRDQLTNMQDNLSSILQVELETHMMQVLGSLQGGVVKKIEESMSKELSRAFRDQQRYFEISVIPRTVTPAVSVCDQITSPSVDPATLQRQVLAMLDSGDITGAFVKATNCADTNLLMTIAGRVRPSEVFTKSLPTSAHLSIIQQMAIDMTSYTETKVSYLQAAMGSLNISDPRVLKSMTRIIPVFHASVKNFLSAKPDSPLVGSIKLLEMAFVGIGNTLRQQQITPNAREDRMSSSTQFLHHGQHQHLYMD